MLKCDKIDAWNLHLLITDMKFYSTVLIDGSITMGESILRSPPVYSTLEAPDEIHMTRT